MSRRGSALLLVLVAVALHGDVVFGNHTYFQRDVQLMWLAGAAAFRSAVMEGTLPLWSPLVGFGEPLLANANHQVLYPTTWLHLLLPPETVYTIIVLSHVLLLGFGVRALGRVRGLGEREAFFAGAATMVAGPVVSLTPVWNQLVGLAWVPWAVAAGYGAGSPWAWGLAIAAPILGGSPEMALGATVVSGAAALARRPVDGPSRRALLRRAGTAAAFAVALSAGQWLPTLDAARRGARADMGFAERTAGSVSPVRLAEVVLDLRLASAPLDPATRAALFESWDPLVRSLHVGTVVVVLALAGLRRRGVALLGMWAGLALVLSLGRHAGPLAALWSLPGLSALRYPEKMVALATPALALLAGHALADWSRQRRTVSVISLLAAAGAGAILIHPEALGSALAPRVISVAPIALGVAGALGVATLLPPSAGALVAAAIGLATGFVASAGLVPAAPAAIFHRRPPALAAVGPAARLFAYDYFADGASRRFLSHDTPYLLARAPVGWPLEAAQALALQEALYPPTSARFGVAGSYDLDVPGLGTPEMARLREALQGAPPDLALQLLRRGAVTHVAALHDPDLRGLRPEGEHAGLLREPTRILAVPEPRPRALAVGTVEVATDPLPPLLDAGVDPLATAVVEAGDPRQAPPGFRGEVEIEAFSSDEVRLHAALSHPGLVVLVEAWDPGWTVAVDGNREPLLRVDGAFRGVAVGAGSHAIRFAYRPPAALGGLVVSALAALTAAARAGLVRLRLSGRAGPAG